MATQIQFRRGTKTQHNSFTGATAEVTVNTTNKSLHVHDGTTQGGFEQAKVDLTNVSGATNLSLSGITTTNSLSIGSTQVISSARQLQNIVSLDATTTATIESAVAAAPNDFTSLNISGLSTFSGITTHTTSLFGRDASFSGVITATSFVGAITGAVTGTATSTTNIPNLTGAITSNNTTTSLGSFSSANLSAALTDETGTGVAVFATSPTLVTPVLGAASATSINSSGIITASTFSGNLANTLTLATSGTGLSGSTTFNNSGASSFTVTSNATNNNTNSTIVARDASGNFSAGTITASLTGTATSTTNIPNLTGAITSVNTATSLGSFTSLQLLTALSDETGSGAAVFATSPTLVTPVLGTPSSGTLTNCTSLPISGLTASTSTALGVGSIELGHATDTTISRVSAGVVAIEGVNVVTTSSTDTLTNKTLTSPTLTTPALGTPSSGTLTSCTGLPVSTGISGLAANVATFLATPSSANLISAVTDETGTGALVFATSPTLVTPVLGSATATSIVVGSGVTINASGIIASAGIITASQLSTGASGTGINITTNTISGPATLTIDPAAVGDNTGAVRIKGDLFVDGTQFIVNSTTIELADFIVGIASTATTDALADGAGIRIGPDNNLTYDHTNTALKSSENFNVASGKTYKINGTDVLSSNTLGSGIVASSLTSVGTLTNLNVGNVNSTGIITATTFVGALTGTATSTTNIPNLTGDITSVNKATTLATVNSNVGTFGSGGSIPTITVNAKGLITGVTTTAVNPANDGTLTLAVSGTGLSGSASFTANQSSASTFTVTSNATNANTVSTIVARDGSGNFSAGTITASLTGTATSTTNIPNLTGDITSVNSVTSIAAGVIVNADINDSAAIAVSKLAASTISGVTLGNNLNALTISTGLSGSSYNGSGAVTIAIDSTVATLTGTQTLTNKTLTSPTLTTPALGTPSSGTLTSCTGLPVSTGVSGLAANVATFLATPSSANLAAALTDETGSGAAVFATSPTLVTPVLGTPSSGTLTSCTGLPISTGVSGLAANVATFLATPSSANLATILTDETGSGVNVFATSPTLVTPVLGAATATSIVVSSGSTFTNGPILVGAATSTGTASQPLQVTGGAYVSGNLGIGTINPLQKLHVLGNLLVAAGSSTGQHITQNAYELNSGTLSWEGTAGQLFSITNNLTSGSIFSVNDVSGIPSIDVDANGTIELAPFGGNVGVGTTNPTSKLHVIGDVRVTGIVTATDFNSTSDISLKDNIQTIVNPLDKIIKLNGVTFNWKENQKPSIGVIAQELEEILPELVTQGDVKSVNYNGLIGVLIEAVKEQQKQIEELKAIVKN